MADGPGSIGDILDCLEQVAAEEERVTLGKTVEAFGSRSHGPFLLIPALIDISPVGGIPGLPTLLAAIIAIVAAQLLLGRRHLWLPAFLERRSLSREKACKAIRQLRGPARFLDRWFHGRMPRFTRGPFVRIAAGLCIVLALAVPPLELVPFATTAPMAAIAAIGLALLVRDGLLMLIAAMLAVAAGVAGVALIGSGG